MQAFSITIVAAALLSLTLGAQAQEVDCGQFPIDVSASVALGPSQPPSQGCDIGQRDGFPVPDPRCTPGAVNPTVTAAVLANPAFRTRCLRNNVTSEGQKAQTYAWYKQAHPAENFGPTQTCELDHLVPLELGGADTLDNIWPQCGPADAPLEARFFKRKDTVENYLAWAVKTGRMDLGTAQRGIASDWPQYLAAAEAACPRGRCPRGY